MVLGISQHFNNTVEAAAAAGTLFAFTPSERRIRLDSTYFAFGWRVFLTGWEAATAAAVVISLFECNLDCIDEILVLGEWFALRVRELIGEWL